MDPLRTSGASYEIYKHASALQIIRCWLSLCLYIKPTRTHPYTRNGTSIRSVTSRTRTLDVRPADCVYPLARETRRHASFSRILRGDPFGGPFEISRSSSVITSRRTTDRVAVTPNVGGMLAIVYRKELLIRYFNGILNYAKIYRRTTRRSVANGPSSGFLECLVIIGKRLSRYCYHRIRGGCSSPSCLVTVLYKFPSRVYWNLSSVFSRI